MSLRTCGLASFLLAALGCCAASTSALDPRGVWAGTIHTDKDHHVVMRVDGPSVYDLRATLYQDERGTDLPVDTVTLDQDVLDVSAIHGAVRLHAKLDPQSRTLSGMATLESSFPLELHRTTEVAAWSTDATAHKISRVQVDKGVSLEVVDWGGSGPPVLLLTGLGNNAHI